MPPRLPCRHRLPGRFRRRATRNRLRGSRGRRRLRRRRRRPRPVPPTGRSSSRSYRPSRESGRGAAATRRRRGRPRAESRRTRRRERIRAVASAARRWRPARASDASSFGSNPSQKRLSTPRRPPWPGSRSPAPAAVTAALLPTLLSTVLERSLDPIGAYDPGPLAPRPDRCLHSRRDADLRVRMHGVREPLRGARSSRRERPGLSRLRLGEDEQAVLRVRGSRHRRAAELRRIRWRLLRRELWLRLTAAPGMPLAARPSPGRRRRMRPRPSHRPRPASR